MKITLLTPALAAILGLALASAPITVQAQTTPAAPAAPAATPTATPKKAAATKPTPYSGSLTAIDTTANTVTVVSTTKKDGAKTLVLSITATTTFENANKPATLADFVVGDKVTGSYTTDGTTMTAHSLHKGMTKGSKKAAKTAAPAAATAPAAPATPPATN